MRKPLYLDYAATTPVDPGVAERMNRCLTMDGIFANPASRSHLPGWQAEEIVEDARAQVADALNADPREIVWTSGATESNNLALKGVAESPGHHRRHIITSAIEHKAVLDPCRFLESRGFSVTYLSPDVDGRIDPGQLTDALREDTLLVSLMHVNNEVGSINPIAEYGRICREKGIVFHVDAAQSAGKLPIDVASMNVDLLSISAHKIYGPKGMGALYVRRSLGIQLVPLIHGGGHERGMRSGTIATHQVAGLGEALQLAERLRPEEQQRIKNLRDRFWSALQTELPDVSVNGSQEERVAGIVNICFGGVDGEKLLGSLRDLAISTGSACNSASVRASYVLRELGLSEQNAHSSLRFSFGRFTEEADVDFAIDRVVESVLRLRGATASLNTH